MQGVSVLDDSNRYIPSEEQPSDVEMEILDQMQNRQEELICEEVSKLKSARCALGEAMTQFQDTQQKLLAEAEPQMIDLILELLQKVLVQEVQLGKYEIAPIVKEALGHVDTYEKITVHLNEEDYQAFLATQDSADSRGPNSVEYVSDPNIGRAECMLETQSGQIHSKLEDKVSEIHTSDQRNL